VDRSTWLLIPSLVLCGAFTAEPVGQQRARTPRAAVVSQPSVPAPSPVIVKEGRLSVAVDRVSAQWVLDEIARQASVKIENTASFATFPLSIAFDGLPVDEGLRRILVPFDAFFFYGASDAKGATLQTIWIYPKGQGASLIPVPPDAWASTGDLERALNDPDGDVRSDAIDQWVERKGDRALDQVLQALRDPEDSVRLRALDAASAHGLDLPDAEVQTIALGDASADVRLAALDILSESPKVKSIAEAALGDASQEVRERATAILKELKDRPTSAGGKDKEVRRPDMDR
jgi:hypothetical protein